MREITELSEMKSIELEIMKYVHNFCVKHKITYFLSHGTLLGAIRHRGFIPWDDDIDIFMPREDYDKFCSAFIEQNNNSNLQLVNHTTSTYFGRPMSKVIDTRTILTEPEFQGDDPIGVFIDIWPLDGVPKGKLQKRIHALHAEFMRKLLYINIRDTAYLSIPRKLMHVCVSFISSKWIVKRFDTIIRKFSFANSEFVTCYLDPYRAIMDKKWFVGQTVRNGGVLKQFEDTQFIVPPEYDRVLTSLYGDYMLLPPIEKQVPHHIVNTYWKGNE